jgi:hypothetical protein
LKARFLIYFIATVVFTLASVSALKMLHERKPYAPPRPSGISADATYIQGPDGKGTWEWCRLDEQNTYCSIRTVGGLILREGRFITYLGPPPTRPEDLQITQRSGDSWISLTNGSYLIPETDNEGTKRYLDFMAGKAKSFDDHPSDKKH